MKGHVIDPNLLWQSEVLDTEPQSIYSFWCEQNTSQFHTFGWIKLLTLGEIQHLSYKHLWSVCDSGSILSVTGQAPQDRKKAAHLFPDVITLNNTRTHSGFNDKWSVNDQFQILRTVSPQQSQPAEVHVSPSSKSAYYLKLSVENLALH